MFCTEYRWTSSCVRVTEDSVRAAVRNGAGMYCGAISGGYLVATDLCGEATVEVGGGEETSRVEADLMVATVRWEVPFVSVDWAQFSYHSSVEWTSPFTVPWGNLLWNLYVCGYPNDVNVSCVVFLRAAVLMLLMIIVAMILFYLGLVCLTMVMLMMFGIA